MQVWIRMICKSVAYANEGHKNSVNYGILLYSLSRLEHVFKKYLWYSQILLILISWYYVDITWVSPSHPNEIHWHLIYFLFYMNHSVVSINLICMYFISLLKILNRWHLLSLLLQMIRIWLPTQYFYFVFLSYNVCVDDELHSYI